MNTVRILFSAMRRIRDCDPSLYQRLRLNFVGTTSNPSQDACDLVTPLATEMGVRTAVHEVPRRLPYLDALAIQANAHGVLMLGSNEPHYTASKIFGVMMSGRPYLSVFHRASSAHGILTRSGGGIALAFDGPEELTALEQPIAEALSRIANTPQSLGTADPVVYAPFAAAEIARRYGAIFDSLRSRTNKAA